MEAAPGGSGIVPQLQNVVCTVNLGCKLELKEIALHARNAEYNPKRFAAVIMRIREPKTTALIFASGKMVCTGAKSEEDARTAARKYAKIVQKLGFSAIFKEFKIQNIVGSCDVKFPIRLEGMAISHRMYANYEPELFPGLIYRMKEPKVVLLVFVSGKVVLTGAKQRTDIHTAFENIYPVLLQFRKGGAAVVPPVPGLPAPTPAAPTPAAPEQGGDMDMDDAGRPPSPRRLPPPTPAHPSLLPATPAHPSLLPAPSGVAGHTVGGHHHHPMDLPPPTPMHPMT